jgi:hypothetical protein
VEDEMQYVLCRIYGEKKHFKNILETIVKNTIAKSYQLFPPKNEIAW